MLVFGQMYPNCSEIFSFFSSKFGSIKFFIIVNVMKNAIVYGILTPFSYKTTMFKSF